MSLHLSALTGPDATGIIQYLEAEPEHAEGKANNRLSAIGYRLSAIVAGEGIVAKLEILVRRCDQYRLYIHCAQWS